MAKAPSSSMLMRGRNTERETASTIVLASNTGCSASMASTCRRIVSMNGVGSDAVRTTSAMPLSGC